jgi:hypothetical protein
LPETIRGAYYSPFGPVTGCAATSELNAGLVDTSDRPFCQAGLSYQRNNPTDELVVSLKAHVTTVFTNLFTTITKNTCCVPYDKSKTPTYSCAQSNIRSGKIDTIINFFFTPGKLLPPTANSYYLYCGSEALPEQVPPLSPDNLRFQYEEDKFVLFPVSCGDSTAISSSSVPPFYSKVGLKVSVSGMCGSLGQLPTTSPTSSPPQQLTGTQLGTLLEGRYPVPPGYTGPLPACAFSGTCKDVNDLLQLGINVGRWIFGLLGSFALVMFVYGGFVWVASGGNPERVKQGKNIVVAAVVGLIIAFGAYILIGFLLDALSVREGFRAIQ